MGCGSAAHRLVALEASAAESVEVQGLDKPQIVGYDRHWAQEYDEIALKRSEQVDQGCKELRDLHESHDAQVTFQPAEVLGTEDEKIRRDVVLDQSTKVVVDKAKLQEIFERTDMEFGSGSDWKERIEETLVRMRADKARAERDLSLVEAQLKRTQENLEKKSKHSMFELSLARADRLKMEEFVKRVKAHSAQREELLLYENRTLTSKLKVTQPVKTWQELEDGWWV